jgi:adenosylcobyric acid synthase
LPGSKHVAADLAWLRGDGLDAAIRRHVEAGKPLLALCGGLQMLGHAITDPHGVEGSASGLGLLPVATELQAIKRHHRDRYTFGSLTGHWAPLSGKCFDAYEIRHGSTRRLAREAPGMNLTTVLPDDAGLQCGAILGLYTHGLFEDAGVLRALFGAEIPSMDWPTSSTRTSASASLTRCFGPELENEQSLSAADRLPHRGGHRGSVCAR